MTSFYSTQVVRLLQPAQVFIFGTSRDSSAILDDLIACAYDDQETHPILGLCVQQDNTVAIDLYKRKKFTEGLTSFTDRETGIVYARMALILAPNRLVAIPDG